MLQLTEDNFILFAIKHYDNPMCRGVKDLETDLKRFKYVKRLLRRYQRTNIISDHLLVNHLIVLHNLFGDAMMPMLFFKIERKFWPQIKTFLVFLNYLPEKYQILPKVSESDIPLDATIIAQLRKL